MSAMPASGERNATLRLALGSGAFAIVRLQLLETLILALTG